MAELTEQAPTASSGADPARTTSTIGHTSTQSPPPQGGIEQLLFMAGPLLIVFYLLIWRPESKRRKQKETLMSNIKVKDKVVTIGGLQGTVAEIGGDDIVLLVDPKKDVKLRYRRSAIDSVLE